MVAVVVSAEVLVDAPPVVGEAGIAVESEVAALAELVEVEAAVVESEAAAEFAVVPALAVDADVEV